MKNEIYFVIRQFNGKYEQHFEGTYKQALQMLDLEDDPLYEDIDDLIKYNAFGDIGYGYTIVGEEFYRSLGGR